MVILVHTSKDQRVLQEVTWWTAAVTNIQQNSLEIQRCTEKRYFVIYKVQHSTKIRNKKIKWRNRIL